MSTSIATPLHTYELLPSAPHVPDSDVESASRTAVEIIVKWGQNILQVAHLSPLRSFVIGSRETEGAPVDFLVPEEKLGSAHHELVHVDGDLVTVQVPPAARGSVDREGSEDSTIAASAPQCLLQLGDRACLEVGDLTFEVAVVRAGKGTPRQGLDKSGRGLTYFAATAGAVGVLLGITAYMVPSLHGLSAEDNNDQLYLLQAYLDAASEREREPDPNSVGENTGSEGDEGSKAPAEEGAAGKETSTQKNHKFAVKGPKENVDPHLARERAREEAATFGIVGLIQQGALDGPLSEFGRDTALGRDDLSAEGALWGDELGEAFGAGGLSVSGIGSGGGGLNGLIGLGDIGFGSGAGTCQGDRCEGFGHGGGLKHGTHTPKGVSVGMAGETTVSGRLPASVIQRIVRQNFGRFRMCYQDGLKSNPNLEGRVAVRFVIGRGGTVEHAQNGGSNLPSSDVVACVTRTFYGLSFPKPEGGIVTVVYPIAFHPA